MSWPRVRRRLRDELQRLKPYEPETAPAGILLDANENPYGPPAGFRERASELMGRLDFNRYPDPRALALREEAARAYGADPEEIVFGNGSDELIQLLMIAFGGVNRSCLIPSPSFSMYRICALANGLVPLEEPLDGDFQLSPNFLDRAVAGAPSLVFLASPNNPTGNGFDRARVLELLNQRQAVVVVDEAYAEFSGASFLPDLKDHPNLVVLRTFSKAYGLAGLRVGILFTNRELASELEKARLPYNLDQVSQALAVLALKMRPAFQEGLARLVKARKFLEESLGRHRQVKVYPSEANFLLLKLDQAAALHRHLLEQGIRVRSFAGHPRLSDCLRVSAGTDGECRAFAAACRGFFGAGGGEKGGEP